MDATTVPVAPPARPGVGDVETQQRLRVHKRVYRHQPHVMAEFMRGHQLCRFGDVVVTPHGYAVGVLDVGGPYGVWTIALAETVYDDATRGQVAARWPEYRPSVVVIGGYERSTQCAQARPILCGKCLSPILVRPVPVVGETEHCLLCFAETGLRFPVSYPPYLLPGVGDPRRHHQLAEALEALAPLRQAQWMPEAELE